MMEIAIEPGKYVVAVSGGVDSVVLLDLLTKLPDLHLIVAHFDHGMRPDSSLDRQLVQQAAKQHNLIFVYDEGHLDAGVSEAAARSARYNFLHSVRAAAGARAIITAHHADDVLETAIFNILRGTGRKGLASLRSHDLLVRPLLHAPKAEIKKYAEENNLSWREDITNQDVKYARNYIRHNILPKFTAKDRQKMSELVTKTRQLNEEIENLLVGHLHVQPALNQLDRHGFTMLPHQVAREVMAAWLRRHDIRDFSTKTLDRLIVAAKTFKTGQSADIDRKNHLNIQKKILSLETRKP